MSNKQKTIRRKKSWPKEAKWISCDIYSATYRFWKQKPRERKGGGQFTGPTKAICLTIMFSKMFPSGEMREIV